MTMSHSERIQLNTLLSVGMDEVTRRFYEGRFSDVVYDAYLALWWYGAPRFQDRPMDFPYVSSVNLMLDKEC
jgi:hypothetical protein